MRQGRGGTHRPFFLNFCPQLSLIKSHKWDMTSNKCPMNWVNRKLLHGKLWEGHTSYGLQSNVWKLGSTCPEHDMKWSGMGLYIVIVLSDLCLQTKLDLNITGVSKWSYRNETIRMWFSCSLEFRLYSVCLFNGISHPSFVCIL